MYILLELIHRLGGMWWIVSGDILLVRSLPCHGVRDSQWSIASVRQAASLYVEMPGGRQTCQSVREIDMCISVTSALPGYQCMVLCGRERGGDFRDTCFSLFRDNKLFLIYHYPKAYNLLTPHRFDHSPRFTPPIRGFQTDWPKSSSSPSAKR